MSENHSESADMDMEIELPPALVQFVNNVRAGQKRLLKDKNFANADQLRKFIATTQLEWLIQAVEMLGTTGYDTHQLGVSNATQLQRMRRWTAEHLRKLGAEVNDGEAFAGIGEEQLNKVGQALYGLGSYLQAKYPGDRELEGRYNAFVVSFNELIATLMGDQSVDDDAGDDDQDDDAADEGDDGSDDAEGDDDAEEADGPTRSPIPDDEESPGDES